MPWPASAPPWRCSRWSSGGTSVALSFVTSRMLEAAIILIGVVSLLAVVTLRRDLAGEPGADTASLVTTGRALVAVRGWIFLLGPGLIPGVNALLLGYSPYRSGLVPRVIPGTGTHRGSAAHRFGNHSTVPRLHPLTVLAAIATAPIFFWELSLGV